VAKALGSEGELGWHAVAVAVDRRGRPSLVISGRALELADRRGVQAWSLDLTADRTRAVALVLAFWRHGRDERDSHP
jgi:phosphopantetheinyl transferase (holo-ACP synthase)